MKLAYKHFRGTYITWPDLFRQAADFASGLGPGRVRGISHSADHHDGIVTVWYLEGVAASRSSRERLAFEYHQGTLISWVELFEKAAETATAVGPDRVLAVTHSADHSAGLVTVWYWD